MGAEETRAAAAIAVVRGPKASSWRLSTWIGLGETGSGPPVWGGPDGAPAGCPADRPRGSARAWDAAPPDPGPERPGRWPPPSLLVRRRHRGRARRSEAWRQDAQDAMDHAAVGDPLARSGCRPVRSSGLSLALSERSRPSGRPLVARRRLHRRAPESRRSRSRSFVIVAVVAWPLGGPRAAARSSVSSPAAGPRDSLPRSRAFSRQGGWPPSPVRPRGPRRGSAVAESGGERAPAPEREGRR